MKISGNGNLLAYTLELEPGSEVYEALVIDLRSGKEYQK